MPSLASGLAKGIQNAQRFQLQKQAKDEQDKMAKLQGQLLELQLKQQQQRQSVLDRLQPDIANPSGNIPTPFLNAGNPAQTAEDKFKNLSVADQIALGSTPAQINKNQLQEQSQGLIEQIIKGQGRPPIESDSPQTGGITGGGFGPPSVSIGPRGTTVNLDPKKIRFENGLAVDQQGNRVPLKDINPADVPLDETGVLSFENEKGENPPIGTTPREIVDGGFQQVTKGQRRSISIEEAGRVSGLAQASVIGQEVKNELFDKEGRFVFGGEGGFVERSLRLANLKFGLTGDGRRIQLRMRDGIDGVLRARTGATANETEMKDLMDQFLPDPRDDDKTIQDKITRFTDFVDGALNAVTLPPSLKNKIETSREFAQRGGSRGFKIINRQ